MARQDPQTNSYLVKDGLHAITTISKTASGTSRQQVIEEMEVGHVGTAPVPARHDHSHPLNVPNVGVDTGHEAKDLVLGDEVDASFGTQGYYCRIDHKHPIVRDMGGASDTPYEPTARRTSSTSPETAGFENPPSIYPLLTNDEWDLSKKPTDGFVEFYVSRIRKVGTSKYLYWRKRKVSKAGVVIFRSKELGCTIV